MMPQEAAENISRIEKNDFGQRAGVRDEADDVGIRGQLAGPSLRLRRLRKTRKGVDRHVQTALRYRFERRWDSAGSTQGSMP